MVETDGRMRVRSVMIVALVVLGAISFVPGSVGAQAAQPTPIDSCTTIDTPGAYVLTSNITNTSADPCISITANDTELDGGGHTLAGNRSNYGIRIDNGEASQSNVTIRNLATDRWVRAIAFMNTTGGLVENTTSTGSIEGYLIQESTNVTIRNNYAHGNSLGIHVRNAEGNQVERNVANDNKWGIHLEYRARYNEIVDNVARNNSNWDLISRQDSTGNVVSRLDIGSGTFSLVPTNVALRATESVPAPPNGRSGINSSVAVANATTEDLSPALDSFAIHYRNASGDTGSLSIQRTDGGSWSTVNSTVQPNASTVVARNLTTFGTFSAFGSDAVSASRATIDATPPALTQRESASGSPAATANASTTTSTTRTGTATATAMATETGTMAPATGGTDSGASGAETTATGPGFGAIAGVIALIGAGLLVARHRRER
jgi:PGF-CTERM protein